MPATRLKIFISSVQKEFAQLRRDLEDLVRRGVLTKVGATGRSTFYVMARKLDTNRTNRT